MADEGNVEEFPNVTQKLSAPKKLSAFERERLAADAKRQKAEAENAAALKAFQDSLDDDDDGGDVDTAPSGPRYSTLPPRGFGTSVGPKSGPGSLGPLPGGPAASLKRKRALDKMREAAELRDHGGVLEGSAAGPAKASPTKATDDVDLELDSQAPRPTLQLSSLPPDWTSKDVISLLSGHLKVHATTFQPVPAHAHGRPSTTAFATLDADVTTPAIDAAVSSLRNKYLGCGYSLSIARHLSSSSLRPNAVVAISDQELFGAKLASDDYGYSMRNAPPPTERRAFYAPPDSYTQVHTRDSEPTDAVVTVDPPPDVGTIRAIHTVVDHILQENDPLRAIELEAMLMALPQVQQDERFSFLFDSSGTAGVYYRYCLWGEEEQDEDVRTVKRRQCQPERLFADVAIDWMPPHLHIPFPDLTDLADVVTHADYDSSDEESDDDEAERAASSKREGGAAFGESPGKTFLTPLQRARLVHLLARLPPSNAKLRRGDVARITDFAIRHAAAGPDEIVDLLLLNVEIPFCFTKAAKFEDDKTSSWSVEDDDDYEPAEDLPSMSFDQSERKRDHDPSAAKLIALYCISDILSASSTAGARNAWKYRQLFETGLKIRQTFASLGHVEKDLSWGRMKAEQWKRRIHVIFDIWDSWSVFQGNVLAEFKREFDGVSVDEDGDALAPAIGGSVGDQASQPSWMAKFKRVEPGVMDKAPDIETRLIAGDPAVAATPATANPADVDGVPVSDEDVDGVPVSDDDVDGVPVSDDIDGTPVPDGDIENDSAKPDEGVAAPTSNAQTPSVSLKLSKPAAVPTKSIGFSLGSASQANANRPTPSTAATLSRNNVDVFAESDDEV